MTRRKQARRATERSVPPGGWMRRRTDRGLMEQQEKMLASPGWRAALEQFARATGLVVSLFDAKAGLRLGPFIPTPLGERFLEVGCWRAPAGFCLKNDVEAVRAALADEGSTVHHTALGALALFAAPLRFEGNRIGAVVAGWVFNTFPDPVLTDRLAKELGVPFPELWQIVRQQLPVSPEKLKTYSELLLTICDLFLQERAETLQEQEQSRELLVLNESAKQLASALTAEEIGRAVVQAVIAFTDTKEARFLVMDEKGSWQTAAEERVEKASVAERERRAIISNLRVPVDASDGSPLGMIELSEPRQMPAEHYRTQLSALAAQTAVALQKVRLIDALESERAQLERANRTKDEFLAVLSHEMRTPLTPILGWVSMLRQGALRADKETVESALAAIERNARQELHLVDEMLDLSRILNNKVVLDPMPINPTEALTSIFTTAQTLTASRELQLELDASQSLPFVNADPQRLQQVLINLVSNAVKFTGDGGRITIGTRMGESGDVEFFVCDTGVGIRPEALPYIFDRFQQADQSTTRRYGGLGIGLSVVRGLVELHGGRVWAQSDGDGCGSTFVVSFPALSSYNSKKQPERETALKTEAKRIDDAKRHAGVRVLVVDDSPDTLAVLKTMMEAAGYQVETASSAHSAVGAAASFKPDIIISDLGMPDTDGFELLRTLREDSGLADTPVIALTGYAMQVDRDATLHAGFAAHLAKPIEQAALVSTLDELLEKAEVKG